MNQICKSAKALFKKYVLVELAMIAVVALSTLSLTADAATVDIFKLDNFFSNVENGAPVSSDGVVTETNIVVGDTVRWTNSASTDHTTTNDIIVEEGIFEGQLWVATLSVGEEFSRTFNEAGEFSYFCSIHGRDDMAGIINVSASVEPTPTETPGPSKRFSFECDKEVTKGISSIETLILNVGETASCVLKLDNMVLY